MALGPEYTQVEKPLIDQLTGMGWLHLEGAAPQAFRPTDPAASGRGSFNEVFLARQLRDAIYRLNCDAKGNPWLTVDRLTQAVNALTRIGSTSLLEANQQATDLLLNGITVDGRARLGRRPGPAGSLHRLGEPGSTTTSWSSRSSAWTSLERKAGSASSRTRCCS